MRHGVLLLLWVSLALLPGSMTACPHPFPGPTASQPAALWTGRTGSLPAEGHPDGVLPLTWQPALRQHLGRVAPVSVRPSLQINVPGVGRLSCCCVFVFSGCSHCRLEVECALETAGTSKEQRLRGGQGYLASSEHDGPAAAWAGGTVPSNRRHTPRLWKCLTRGT